MDVPKDVSVGQPVFFVWIFLWTYKSSTKRLNNNVFKLRRCQAKIINFIRMLNAVPLKKIQQGTVLQFVFNKSFSLS